MLRYLSIMVLITAFSGYLFAQERNYMPTEHLVKLEVSFADKAWDGITVPEGEQCSMFGGNGSSPSLIVSNIPDGVNALIISFSDRSFKANDNGGHGIIGIWLEEGQKSVTVPSVLAESLEMPEGMFIEANFRSNRGKSGAYLPPCSGGRGNEYYATIKAVYRSDNDTEESMLLGESIIEMGRY